MRIIVIRSSKVLLTLAGIGILIMAIALLFFTGVASSVDITVDPPTWNRLVYGFDYRILTAFGFFLLLFLSPVLASLDVNAKKSVKKIYVHLVLIVGLGVLMLIYSALVSVDRLTPFDLLHTWFDYFIVGALLIIVGLSPILFSVQNRERVWNFKLLFILFILVGLLLHVLSLVLYSQTVEIPEIGWEILFLFGVIILFIGVFPLLLTASTRFRNILRRLGIIWILGALIGILIIIGSILIYADIVQLLVPKEDWFVILAYGSLLTLLFILPLASVGYEIIHKLRFIWLVTLFLGIIFVVISAILVLPESPEIKAAVGTLLGNSLLGATWDIFYMYGIIIIIFSLSFICSILYFETEEIIGPEGLLEVVDRLPDVETTPSEMIAYLEILSKSHENLVNQFKEAVRADKFRPRVYESIVKIYQNRSRTIKSRIESFQKAGPLVSAAEDVEAIFDVALGEPSEVTPPGKPVISPTPSTAEVSPEPPPIPPKVPPSAPLMPPPSVTPPVPPPSPLTTAPPAPGAAPAQPTESPLDLIADARSTSIAELRGEMLKELRRLREIFKEE
ncbi:MAG: hypothetical protein JSU57_06420 [Candidatus Heimdallarchaeota archaeon]|nr:MAG: hypothetical protein JSU57_06420 [Candidatus Heimdallarchaeota archaeon]